MRGVLIAAALLVSCQPANAPCDSVSLCTAMSSQYSAQLAGIAAKQGLPVSDVTKQFVDACSSRVDSDIKETAADLNVVFADSGLLGKRK